MTGASFLRAVLWVTGSLIIQLQVTAVAQEAIKHTLILSETVILQLGLFPLPQAERAIARAFRPRKQMDQRNPTRLSSCWVRFPSLLRSGWGWL